MCVYIHKNAQVVFDKLIQWLYITTPTMLSHEQLLAVLCENKFVSGLFDLPGFLASFITIDVMHCIDLGILQYLLGNVLYEIFIEMGGRITRPGETIADIMILIKKSNRDIGQAAPPINLMSFPMIKADKKEPKLKLKGSEGRNLLPCIVHMCQKYLPPKSAYQSLRLECMMVAVCCRALRHVLPLPNL